MKIPKHTSVYNRKTKLYEWTKKDIDVVVDDTVYPHYYVFRYKKVEFVVARIFVDKEAENGS